MPPAVSIIFLGELSLLYRPTEREERILACLLEAIALGRKNEGIWPGWTLGRDPLALYWPPEGPFFLFGFSPSPPGGMRVVRAPVFYFPRLPAALPGGVAHMEFGGRLCAFLPCDAVKTLEEAVEFISFLWEESFRLHRRRKVRAQLLVPYPADLPVNNALGNIEGQILLEGCRNGEDFDLRYLASAFSLIRRERRSLLAEELIAYEQSREAGDGLAAYVGYRVLEIMSQPGYVPTSTFRRLFGWQRGEPARKLTADRLNMLGSINRMGNGAVRKRFFYSGMGIALLLDRLDPRWKEELEKGSNLDQLLEKHVSFDGGAGDDRLITEVECRYGYVKMLSEERKASRESRRRRRELFQSLYRREGMFLILDLGELERLGEEWDPERAEVVNERLCIHTGRAFFNYGTAAVSFSGEIPFLEDRSQGLFEISLPHRRFRITGDDQVLRLPRPATFTEGLELDLGSVKLSATRGYIYPLSDMLYIKIWS